MGLHIWKITCRAKTFSVTSLRNDVVKKVSLVTPKYFPPSMMNFLFPDSLLLPLDIAWIVQCSASLAFFDDKVAVDGCI